MRFVGAKVSHLGLLPQGQPERWSRVHAMVAARTASAWRLHNFLECAAVCPKNVSPDFIGRLNRDLIGAVFLARPRVASTEVQT